MRYFQSEIKGWGKGTVVQRSRVHGVDMAALTHCCCEYDGAVALAGTNFEHARAGDDVPRLDYFDTMFELGTIT